MAFGISDEFNYNCCILHRPECTSICVWLAESSKNTEQLRQQIPGSSARSRVRKWPVPDTESGVRFYPKSRWLGESMTAKILTRYIHFDDLKRHFVKKCMNASKQLWSTSCYMILPNKSYFRRFFSLKGKGNHLYPHHTSHTHAPCLAPPAPQQLAPGTCAKTGRIRSTIENLGQFVKLHTQGFIFSFMGEHKYQSWAQLSMSVEKSVVHWSVDKRNKVIFTIVKLSTEQRNS